MFRRLHYGNSTGRYRVSADRLDVIPAGLAVVVAVDLAAHARFAATGVVAWKK